jgi:3',5'-cyclic AMP phosphodiesterase CpdA
MVEPHNMKETFTLAHLSDFHLASLNRVTIAELLNKRILGYLKWQLRRRGEHRREVLDALLRDLKATTPDHTVVTGDLTHLGLPREFQQARNFLHSVGSPARVTVIPGNHDTYVKTDWKDTFVHLADFMVSDEPYSHGEAGTNFDNTFPSLRIRGLVAMVGVSTARPSNPFLAVGSVGKIQLRELEKILLETGQQQLFRIVLIHHPPVIGTVSWRKRLTDGAAFRGVLARQGVELVLHGHAHRGSLAHLETPVGKAPAIGVPSASALGRTYKRCARYHIYRLSRNPKGWEILISVRCYSPSSERFVEERETHLALPRPVT